MSYTAAMLVSAAASAIDASGGDEYLTTAAAASKDGSASSEDGSNDSSSVKANRTSPPDAAQNVRQAAAIPNSPARIRLLDLAGACTEQAKHEEARDGLLALSPQRRPYLPTKSATMPALPAKLDLREET